VAVAYVLSTVALTVYGQLAFKWRIDALLGPDGLTGSRTSQVLHVATDPWVISTILASGVAAITWGAALSTLELSFAYPFMALSFALVVVLSAVLLGEPLTAAKVTGVALIAAGIAVVAL
jgi:multidrug transporter EmrE-like cation transporter